MDYDDNDVDYNDEEYFMDDDEDEYQRYAIVRDKAGHRLMHATDRRTYTETEKAENHFKAVWGEDYEQAMETNLTPPETEKPPPTESFWRSATPSTKVQLTAKTVSSHYEDVTLSHLSSTTPTVDQPTLLWEKQFDAEEEAVEEASVPEPKVETPLKETPFRTEATTSSSTVTPKPLDDRTLIPSKPDLEVTHGQKAKKQKPTSSSAEPPAAFLREGGSKKSRRRRRKNALSKASKNGTNLTPPRKQPGAHSATKQLNESSESNPPPSISPQSPKESTTNTLRQNPLQGLETLIPLMKTFLEAASNGTSNELSQKTPNQESLTQ
jgi:hypothetical protein